LNKRNLKIWYKNCLPKILRRIKMKCNRCGGVMVYEKFFGVSEEFFGWRCISCGEIVDRVILENRLEQKRGPSISRN
jgi:tRNA(Ile2) C34 agmatinyltransferase TiaS